MPKLLRFNDIRDHHSSYVNVDQILRAEFVFDVDFWKIYLHMVNGEIFVEWIEDGQENPADDETAQARWLFVLYEIQGIDVLHMNVLTIQ